MSPIPVHANTYFVQVVMRPDTVPNSNTFVNTFFFGDTVPDEDPDVVADSIKEVLDSFYSVVHSPATTTIASKMSAVIDPSLTEFRVYNLGLPSPRIPIVRDADVWTLASTALPNEVAAVLSYRSGAATVNGGSPNPRKRGRLYIGPLGTNAVQLDAGAQDTKLTDALVQNLVAGGDYLRDQTDEPLAWLQYSAIADALDFVTGGFVDNRADTQRRRGAAASSRTVW